MYKTDPNFRKGMKVAVIESTGEIIAKDFKIKISAKYNDYEIVKLNYFNTNWVLAGYGKCTCENPTDHTCDYCDHMEEQAILKNAKLESYASEFIKENHKDNSIKKVKDSWDRDEVVKLIKSLECFPIVYEENLTGKRKTNRNWEFDNTDNWFDKWIEENL